MEIQQYRDAEVTEGRGVELEPYPPKGYIILKAVASDGTLVEKSLITKELDSPAARQFRVDHLWNAIEEYEALVMGKKMTSPSPRPALSIA